jgi:class 3 adenylate cyclase
VTSAISFGSSLPPIWLSRRDTGRRNEIMSAVRGLRSSERDHGAPGRSLTTRSRLRELDGHASVPTHRIAPLLRWVGAHPMAEARVERRLAAILAADVAGYSRLMGADEVGTLAALKAHRREVVDPAIAQHSRPDRQDHRRRHAG